jgi:hypothetical protein
LSSRVIVSHLLSSGFAAASDLKRLLVTHGDCCSKLVMKGSPVRVRASAFSPIAGMFVILDNADKA